jgi:hypothetical protein
MATVLNVPVPEEVASRLQVRARDEGVDVLTLASRSLTRESLRPLLRDVLKPVQDAFAQSGMSDDDLSEFLEAEKHEMRGVRYGRD